MGVIEVRIRQEFDTDAVPLMTWDVNELDAVVPFLERHGVSIDGWDDTEWAIWTRIRHDGRCAYFEAVLSTS